MTAHTVTGLTNDTEYMFRVAGVNHTRGDWSSSVAVTPSVAVTDPDFASVSLLLHGDGANESTTITDSSASPKTISRFGDAQVSTSQAQFGGASLKFDGSGDYLQIQDNSFALGTSDFTIEFWVYFPSGFSYSSGMSPLYIGGTSGGAFSPFSIRDSSGNVSSYISGTSAWSIASNRTFTTIVRDTWLHWAITRSGSSWKTFEDGVVKDSWTNSQPIDNPAGQGDVLLVARATTDGAKEVQCFIDDLRITAGVARYTAAFTPPTAAFPDA
jgi:hypothetical protein